jgi:hypothetical protein
LARIEFSDLETLKEWADAHCNPNNYEIFFIGIETVNSVVFAPTKSTSHLRYGFMKIVCAAEYEKIKEFASHKQLKSYNVEKFAWDASRP